MSYQFEGGCYFLGDTHSVPKTRGLLGHIPPDSLVQHAGDFGLGFQPYQKDLADLGFLNDFLISKDIMLWAISGNHDRPDFWRGDLNKELNNKFSHIELIPDYTRREVNGQSFLFVGGAISVDRSFRIEGRDYWAAEEVVRVDLAELEPCDVLVCHTAPSFIGPPSRGPFPMSFKDRDPTLIEELESEREYMDRLFARVRPRYAFFGHFHVAETYYHEGCKMRILDINELVEHVPRSRGM